MEQPIDWRNPPFIPTDVFAFDFMKTVERVGAFLTFIIIMMTTNLVWKLEEIDHLSY